MAGPFFSEGTFTKNTPLEVNSMMEGLGNWANGRREPLAELLRRADLSLPLKPAATPVSTQAFMGQWHVLAVIPTPFEIGASNGVENYTYDERRGEINVLFEYAGRGGRGPTKVKQKARVTNAPINSQWAINPQVRPCTAPVQSLYSPC